ncbi:MAG TPA: hypothetical protein VH518_12635, partial [Tepidisphaeraceae bacterium]
MSQFPPAPPMPPVPPAPPSQPLDYRYGPPQDGGARWPAVLAWLVILAIVAFVAISSAKSSKAHAAAAATQPAHHGAGDVQFEIIGKYAVGASRLLTPATAATTAPAAKVADLVRQVDKLADTNHKKIDAAIIAGEVLGVAEATRRLDAIEADPRTTPNSREDAALLRRIYTDGPGSLSEADHGRLIDRHGFFGRLAL